MKLKHFALILSVMALVGLTACEEWQVPTDTDLPESTFVLDNTAQINADLATTLIADATLNNDVFIPGTDAVFANCVMGRDDVGAKRPPKEAMMLGKLMRMLKLTEEQVTLLKQYNQEHRDCIETIMTKWREAVAPIIEKANAEKKLIMDALKNKEITREEAYAKLKVLNKSVREQIEALGMREEMKIAIEDCNKALIEKIKAMLTEEQLAIWNKYFPPRK